MPGRILLWLCGPVLGNLALRIPTTDAPPDELGSSQVSLDTLDSGEGTLPSPEAFRKMWQKRRRSEQHLQDPLPPSVRLLLGIMSVAQDSAYRTVVRRTWMQRAGVCYWGPLPRQNCSVYVAFVFGKNGTGTGKNKVEVSDEELTRSHSEEGALVLDIKENMNEGKSFVWFATALEEFPWATHVAKMDIDTYPYLHKLVRGMDAKSGCAGRSSPYEIFGAPHDNASLPYDGDCLWRDCRGYASEPRCMRDTWFGGQLYIMSLPLVKQIDWTPRKGPEDIEVSDAVQSALQRLNSSADFRQLDAWEHSRRKGKK